MRMVHQIEEKLDSDKIKAVLAPQSRQLLTVLEVKEVISSTNTYLLACAKSGGSSGYFCFAEQQTQGRGRQGRAWFSPSGANIYCSLLWYFPSKMPDFAGLSIAVAVMVMQALKRYGIEEIELKWPNDILYQGRKLAGILLESLPERGGQIAVVMGIGLNVQLPPTPETTDWIDVATITGRAVARNQLAGLLADTLLAQLPLYQQKGLAAFMSAWDQHDILRNKTVNVYTPTATVVGVAEGISAQGELCLRSAAGEQQWFRCGEVSIRLKKEE